MFLFSPDDQKINCVLAIVGMYLVIFGEKVKTTVLWVVINKE